MWTFINGLQKKIKKIKQKRILCNRILHIQFNLHPIVFTKSLRMSEMQLPVKYFFIIFFLLK